MTHYQNAFDCIASYTTDEVALFIEPGPNGMTHNAIFEVEVMENNPKRGFPAREFISDERMYDGIDARSLKLIEEGFMHAAVFRFNAGALPAMRRALREARPTAQPLLEAELELAQHYANSPLLVMHLVPEAIRANQARVDEIVATIEPISVARRKSTQATCASLGIDLGVDL